VGAGLRPNDYESKITSGRLSLTPIGAAEVAVLHRLWIIAPSALVRKLPLLTLNLGHFRMIEGLVLLPTRVLSISAVRLPSCL